jgi:tetratricopeptide (TPR) repeat protein
MLGLSAWKDGQLETAEKAFNQSLTLDPNHLKSCINLARVLLDSHRASKRCRCSIVRWRSTRRRVPPIVLKGRAFHDLNQIDDAIITYQGAIALDPTDAWSMNIPRVRVDPAGPL